MRDHPNAPAAALWGLLIAASACAEQHEGDARAPVGAGDDMTSSGAAVSSDPPSAAGMGPTTPSGMAPQPPGPSMLAPTPPISAPVPGTTPSARPITLPEPEPFDPMRTSCSSPRASEGVWLVVGALNHACTVDDDCFVSVGKVSCSKECALVSLNVAERANAEHGRAAVEDTYCAPYRSANCPGLAPTDCGSEGLLPRCEAGYCGYVAPYCQAGCMPEGAGGTCRGAEHCDGCPSVLIEADGVPCSKPGQSCTLESWCSPRVECKDSREPGVFRWELSTILC